MPPTLIWLGIDAVRHRRAPSQPQCGRPAFTSPARVIRQGYLVGVSNPKGFAFFASVLPQFVDPGLGHVPLQMFVLGLLCCTIALLSDSVWALAAGTAAAGSRDHRGASLRSAAPAASPRSRWACAWQRRDAMTDQLTPDELAHTYAAAWLEKDRGTRRGLLERCCQPDVRFLAEGSEREVVGIDEIEAMIAEFQAGWPTDRNVDVQITTPIQEHHGYGRGGFVWIFGDDRSYGTDFVEVRDGKMQTIVVFGDPGPPSTG